MNATLFDWQLVAVLACVAWAAIVVVRRTVRLFDASPTKGCGSGGCSACPSDLSVSSNVHSKEGFVPLQTLVNASQSLRKESSP